MRKEKQLLLDEIKQKIDCASAMIVTRYDKLEPNLSWEFRGLLNQKGSLFEVVQKRVFVKAASAAGIALDPELLAGHIGVLFINQPDALAPTKVLYQFAKDHGDLFKVLGGKVEGKWMPGADIELLSQLPPLDEMRATLIALLTAPLSGLLAVLEAVMAEPLSILEQKSVGESKQ